MEKTMYKASCWYRPEIEEVIVSGETNSFVLFGTDRRRVKKSTDNCSYFDTWEAAKSWLLKIYEARAQRARISFENSNGLLGNVRGMKK